MKIRNGFVSNSSSSSFICDTKMSVEEVRDKLQKIVEFYNDMTDERLMFDEVFHEPFVSDDSYCNSSWADHYYAMKESKGKIIIESAGDNSIPYLLMDFIESIFDADRCHLG